MENVVVGSGGGGDGEKGGLFVQLVREIKWEWKRRGCVVDLYMI